MKKRQRRRSRNPTNLTKQPPDGERARSPEVQQTQSQAEKPAVAAAVHSLEVRGFAGPIPSPEAVAAYKRIDPSFPGRFLKMAEDQNQHRIKVENRDSWTEAVQRIGSFVMASLVTLAFVYLGVMLVLAGRDVEGIVALIAAVTPIVIGFATRTRSQTKSVTKTTP